MYSDTSLFVIRNYGIADRRSIWTQTSSTSIVIRDTLIVRKVLAIGEGLAKTNTKLKFLRGVKADHNDICCMREGSYELGAVTEFIDSCIAKIREAAMIEKQECIQCERRTSIPPIFSLPGFSPPLSTLTLGQRMSSTFYDSWREIAKLGLDLKDETLSSRLGSGSVITSTGKSISTATSIDIIPDSGSQRPCLNERSCACMADQFIEILQALTSPKLRRSFLSHRV